MTFLGYRYHAGDGSRVIPSAITPVRHRAPPRGGDPWPPLREAARAALVTASHVRMVLGRDRVRGRESTGRSFTPGFQDRSRPIPSTYARKHATRRTPPAPPGRGPPLTNGQGGGRAARSSARRGNGPGKPPGRSHPTIEAVSEV